MNFRGGDARFWAITLMLAAALVIELDHKSVGDTKRMLERERERESGMG